MGGLAVALTATLAGQSAAASSRALYFDNQGEPGQTSCSAAYVLVQKSTHGHPCGHVIAVAQGTGYTYTDQYISTTKSTGFRLDARRHVTGTIYLSSYPYVNIETGSGGVLPSPPGPLGAKVVVYVNNVAIGTANGSGVATPNGTVAFPVDLTIPRSLNRKVVKQVIAEVSYTSGLGVTSVSYAPGSASVLNFPSA